VHLACHGRFVPSLPSASGVRLADGWMPLRDIVELGLDADLVFLSGCETGRHAVDIGDELAGIARAFLAGGARRLVTTLWSVRDAAAIEVATRFHEGFSRGLRPSAALRAAMLASLRNRVHPSWWAPFVTTGVL
jgi:CHAT domain-containing protein